MPGHASLIRYSSDMSVGLLRAWLYSNWFYAGLLTALFLLAVTPVLWHLWPLPLLVVFLQLPVYMIHQVEEHHHDRFRRYINQHVAKGRDALSPDAVLVINLGGVWLLDLCALYLAYFVRPGLGLVAMYMAIVNGFVHMISTVVERQYNPGVITAVFLLLPAGFAGCWIFKRTGQATVNDHLWALAVAVLIHFIIVGWVGFRFQQLQRAETA